jgi:HEAT repeat protein
MSQSNRISAEQRLQSYEKLAGAHGKALRPREAAAAMLDLGRDLRAVDRLEIAEQAVAVGRRLASSEAVEALLDHAEQSAPPAEDLATALRFRGASAVPTVLERLHVAPNRDVRKTLFSAVVALGAYPEVRGGLIAHLVQGLSDRRWEVARNAIALLTALGEPLPADRLWDLAHFPHRQVRLALAQVVARWRPGAQGLELLIPMLSDADAGVRFAAAIALRGYPHPQARAALERRAAVETDPETRAACAAAVGRRAVELRSA